MSIKVEVELIKTKNGSEVIYNYKGRLLGLASEMEATKIAENIGVCSRVFTQETRRLKDVVSLIDKNSLVDNKELAGHIVMTATEMSEGKDADLLKTFSRQMFVSPPITMTSETGKDTHTDLVSSTMDCSDESILTIKEVDE